MIETTFINSTLALYSDRDLSWVQELLTTKGYLADPVTGAATFQLSENSPNAHNIIVKAGHLIADFTKGGNTWKVKIKNTADTVLSVPQNVSGSTKYVHIVVKIDNVTEPNVARSNISSLVAVSLSTATPTTGDIQAVIGAFDFYSLGYVTQVNTNAVISNSIITNQSTKVTLTKAIDIPSAQVVYPSGSFSGTTYPVAPYVGQVFYKTTAPIGQQYWDGSAWVTPITDLSPYLGTSSFVAGETFTGATVPQPARLINDLSQPFYDTNSVFVAGTIRWAVRIIPRNNCTLSKVTMPYLFDNASDNTLTITATIQTDSSGSPSGTVITNGTSSSNNLNTNTVQQVGYGNYTFSTPPSLVAGTTYWVVMTLSGTPVGNVRIPTYSVASYCSFIGKSYNGSVWTSSNMPSIELVPATGHSYSLWLSDANGNPPLQAVDYFALSSGSAGASISVRKAGQIPGFTSLDPNADYFLSNTAGTLTKNTNEGQFVGNAVSATVLNVNGQKAAYAFPFGPISTSGSAVGFYQFPVVMLEDGILSGTIQADATGGGNVAPFYICKGRSSANNTVPSTIAAITSGTENGGRNQSTFTLALRKGERIFPLSTNGSSGQCGISNVQFTPN